TQVEASAREAPNIVPRATSVPTAIHHQQNLKFSVVSISILILDPRALDPSVGIFRHASRRSNIRSGWSSTERLGHCGVFKGLSEYQEISERLIVVKSSDGLRQQGCGRHNIEFVAHRPNRP